MTSDAARIIQALQSTPFAVPLNSSSAVIAAMNDARAQLLAAAVRATTGTPLAPSHAQPTSSAARARALAAGVLREAQLQEPRETQQPNAIQRLKIRQAMRDM